METTEIGSIFGAPAWIPWTVYLFLWTVSRRLKETAKTSNSNQWCLSLSRDSSWDYVIECFRDSLTLLCPHFIVHGLPDSFIYTSSLSYTILWNIILSSKCQILHLNSKHSLQKKKWMQNLASKTCRIWFSKTIPKIGGKKNLLSYFFF